MKKFLFFIFSLTLFLLPCFGMGGYYEEVETWFKASRGFNYVDSTYFLINYHLFNRPKGISRFPDGGRVRTVEEGVFLMSLEGRELRMIMKIHDRSGQDLEVMGVRGRMDEGELELIFIPKKADYYLVIRGLKEFRMESIPGTIDEEDFPLTGELSITDVSNIVREIGFSGSGLPDPMDHVSKRARELEDDVVRLRGDFFYRKAALARMELNREEAEDLLQRMDRRFESLDGYDQTAYEIYSEDTRREIEKYFSVK